ncbi:hypothetical protein DL89DRAFT_264139 [Linderina pennispora]|uniref:Uncharacterized protein n=1 Tax=Linderina pennispora TaxID=61395 RepID=A0A1Y1WKU3_9FUNG|nr:uncharacterized protein DL89DRAFT_264139 [Linderina pennispora]ORX74201.1 hypothetical protein DL89DRAFT_264139 [Linderina pennispora]
MHVATYLAATLLVASCTVLADVLNYEHTPLPNCRREVMQENLPTLANKIQLHTLSPEDTKEMLASGKLGDTSKRRAHIRARKMGDPPMFTRTLRPIYNKPP